MSLPQVGQTVQYFGSNGKPLAAIVTMTAAEFDPEKAGSYAAPDQPTDPTAVSLQVIRPSGRTYARHNVPLQGSEAHEALKEAADAHKAQLEEGLPEDITAEDLAESAEEAGDVTSYTPAAKVRYWAPVPA
jgi:hypothetical protein